MRTRLTIKPGHPGARHLTQIYGERLVCVRSRYDFARRRRVKTVELIVAEVPWEPPASWRSETLDAASPVRPAGSFPGLSPSVPAEPSPSVLGAAQAASLPPALGASQPSRPQTQESGDRDVRARLSTVPRRPWLHPRTVASTRDVRGEAEEAGDHARGGTRDGARDEPRDEPRDDARDEERGAIR